MSRIYTEIKKGLNTSFFKIVHHLLDNRTWTSHMDITRSQTHSNTVIFNLGCQPDYIWNHLRGQLRGTAVRTFSIKLFEMGRLILPVAAGWKEVWGSLPWRLAGESIYLDAAIPSHYYYNPDSLGFQHGLKTGGSPGMSRLQSQVGTDIQSWSKQLPVWTAIAGLPRPYHEGQFNQSPFSVY